MHNPCVGRHDLERVERLLAPAQEAVALLVALELALGVDLEGVARGEGVDLDGVVDHELGGHERLDREGIAAERRHRVAHRREVDHGGDPREVLHQHPCRGEGDLLARLRMGIPTRERLDVRARHRSVALGAQQVLEQDLQREGESCHIEALLERVEPEHLVLAPPHLERALCAKTVLRHRPLQAVSGVCGGASSLAERAASGRRLNGGRDAVVRAAWRWLR